MNIAFLANPTVGHTNFLISLANKFNSMNHDICFYIPGVNSDLLINLLDNPALKINKKLNKNNIPYKLLPFSISQLYRGFMLSYKRGFAEVLYALKFFYSGSLKSTELLEKYFKSNKPDLIIYDYTYFPAIFISQLLNIPRVAVYHSGLPFLEFPIPPIGTNLKYGQYSLEVFDQYKKLVNKEENKIMKDFELKYKRKLNSKLLEKPSGSVLNIVNTIIEAEYPRKDMNSYLTYCGPSIQGNSIENISKYNKDDKKIIYISLGTVFNKQPLLFKRIIESIPVNQYRLIISSGQSYNYLKKQFVHPDIIIEKFVNQIDILKIASIFITHGGKNSINESIKYGVPMILFPAGGEQEYNANLIEYIKCGINFSDKIKYFGKSEMSGAINQLLNTNQMMESVRFLSAKHQIDGAEIAYNKIINAYESN